MFHSHDDPTVLLRNVDCGKAAALVPFHLASHEGMKPLPPCSWICFALPGSVYDRNLTDGDVERCMRVSTLRYLMEGAFEFSEVCKKLPVFGNVISPETVMWSLHKLGEETAFDTVSVRRTPAELKMQIDEYLENASREIRGLFVLSDISSFTPLPSIFLGSEPGYGTLYTDKLCVSIAVVESFTYDSLLEPGQVSLGSRSSLLALFGELHVPENLENRSLQGGAAMVALQTAFDSFAKNEPELAAMSTVRFVRIAFWDWLHLKTGALGLPLDDSGTGFHASQVPQRLNTRLGFNESSEINKQNYFSRHLPQVLKFFPCLERLCVTATVPDAIRLILKLGSDLVSSRKEITSVSSLTLFEKVEESLEKFEEKVVTFMAEDGNERHAASRCVAMLIQHKDDFDRALTVSDKDRGSGDKDVMAATSSVVSYLNSPMVQDLSNFVKSRLVPFTDQDGTVTEAASKSEILMMFLTMRHGALTRYILGLQSFTADIITGNALLRAGTDVRLQSTAWNNKETPQVINDALSLLVLPKYMNEFAGNELSVFHNYLFEKKVVEALLRGKEWASLDLEKTFVHQIKACEAQIPLETYYKNMKSGGRENSVSFTSRESMIKLLERLAEVFTHLLGYSDSGDFSFQYVMRFAIKALEMAETRPSHAVDIQMAVHEMMKQLLREAGDQFADFLGKREILDGSCFPTTWVPSTTTAFKPMLALLEEAKKANVSARVAPMYAMGFLNKREDAEEGLPALLKNDRRVCS